MKHRLSGSKYALAIDCAYWARADVTCPDKPSGLAARIGTAVHAHVEAHAKGFTVETNEDLEAFPMVRQATGWLDKADIPHAVEVAIIYNAATDTARAVESAGHRNYGHLGPMEIPTTLDLVWLEPDAVVVRDLKTGAKQHARVEQLYIQALAASRLYGRPRARVGFLWARKTKCAADDLEEMGPGELEAESWRAASVLRRLPMAEPQPGQHCWTCPLGRDRCPAHTAPTETDMAEAFAPVEQERAL